MLLPPGEHGIGNAGVNDLVLPVSGASRLHALRAVELRLEIDAVALRLEDHVRETERRVILEALQREAARLLGVARSTLLRKIDKLSIPT